MAGDDPTIRYLAFISYSHAGDRQVAAAVQDGLLRLGHAWYQRPRFRIFRDDTSLTASPQLWGMIETALGGWCLSSGGPPALCWASGE
jgi:hypothetical protein